MAIILVFCLFSSLLFSLKIVVSVKPLELVVREIVGEAGEIEILVPEGSNPHTYSLTLRDRKTVEEADVVFILGEGFDGWLRSMASGKIHVLSKDFKREFSENVHIWLDPVAVLWMALDITDTVASLDPSNSEIYRKNFSRFARALGESWKKLNWKPDKPVLEVHPALYHLVRRMGGELLWVSSGHGETLSLRKLRELIRRCGKEGVKTLIVEKGVDYRVALPLVEALDLEIVYVDVLGWEARSYVEMLTKIVHILKTSR